TLKSWIGVRDEIVRENPHLMERAAMRVAIPANLKPMMRPVSRGRAVAMPQRLNQRILPSFKQKAKPVAAQYLFGDSARFQQAESFLEKIWSKIDIGIFLLKTIEVHAGAVLEIGTDIQVLWASKLKIHDGGLVRISLGNTFKLDVDVLERV
ncbi:MAG: hypothetical protein GY852_06270, partial [bacterium]|nr:hypothetical protein [bacterium]